MEFRELMLLLLVSILSLFSHKKGLLIIIVLIQSCIKLLVNLKILNCQAFRLILQYISI